MTLPFLAKLDLYEGSCQCRQMNSTEHILLCKWLGNTDAFHGFYHLILNKARLSQTPQLSGFGSISELPDEVLEHIIGFCDFATLGRAICLSLVSY